jgi:hypothetical protein
MVYKTNSCVTVSKTFKKRHTCERGINSGTEKIISFRIKLSVWEKPATDRLKAN